MNPSKRIARNRVKARFVRNEQAFKYGFKCLKTFRKAFDKAMKIGASLRSVPRS